MQQLGPAQPNAVTKEQASAIAASPFTTLGLSSRIVRALVEEGYAAPTPIQAKVIPEVIRGRDVLACAQTGTGKTAAFVLPILERMASDSREAGDTRMRGEGRDSREGREAAKVRVLILTPTRELAAQIAERVSAYGRYTGARYAVIYGGVSQYRQEAALRRGPELLVATPGRLLDLMNQRLVGLESVKYFVLDEADRMLDMGFIHDVRRIAAAIPPLRQTLLLSATMPRDIEALAQSLLSDPVRVAVASPSTTAENIEESVVFVGQHQKAALLDHLLQHEPIARAIVFTRTKRGANKVSERLDRTGVGAAVIHGNKSQAARERALAAFRSGRTRVLVATDIAARGIDVTGISHVFNFDLPDDPASYVHRIGRTARAGASGRAISFCDREERSLLVDIERLIRRRIAVLGDDVTGFVTEAAREPASPAAPAALSGGSRLRGFRRRRR